MQTFFVSKGRMAAFADLGQSGVHLPTFRSVFELWPWQLTVRCRPQRFRTAGTVSIICRPGTLSKRLPAGHLVDAVPVHARQ